MNLSGGFKIWVRGGGAGGGVVGNKYAQKNPPRRRRKVLIFVTFAETKGLEPCNMNTNYELRNCELNF